MILKTLKCALIAALTLTTSLSCMVEESPTTTETNVLGFNLLNSLSGHWVGKNETAFGVYDWFSFDFRSISSSHIHSIYEGASSQNIINSFFVAKYDGKNQIMARNGGWLGDQYRATYYILDQAEETEDKKYYRLIDAVGGKDRSYMELTFENGEFKFEAFKDNSGQLDEPILHMSFVGTNYDPELAKEAASSNNFPKNNIESDMENKFVNLVDEGSALFLEESEDPFPRSTHPYVSDLEIKIDKSEELVKQPLMLYLSSAPIVDGKGQVDFDNLNTKLIRTINVYGDESEYIATYVHPGDYYVTVFSDYDDNQYPSQGDISSKSLFVKVSPESYESINCEPQLTI